MKWLDKYEKAQNSKELTDIPSQARDNTNIQPIIKPNIDLSRARSMEQVEYDNAMARAAEWAGTAKPTENQPLYSKLWDIGVNPMSALESLTQTGRIPDNLGAAIQSGNVARNPLDIATDVVNPVATTDYVSQLPTAIAEGDMLGIADRALSIIPGIKAAKGLLGLARTGRRGVSTLSRASRTTKSSRLVPEGGFTDIADAEALMPLVGKDPNLSIDEILKAGGSRYTMKDLSKISSDGSTKGQLKAMNELLLAYQKHTNNFEGLINDFTLIRPDKYDANTVINRSKISREDAIKVAKTKEDRELIEALTDAEFEDTVIKPGGQVVKYDDNLSFNKGDLIDKWGFYEQGPIQSYVDEFNKNLPRLNEIITQNNKSGTPYEVLKLTSDGGLFFKSDLGISNFNLGISPGKFTGQVSPNVNTQYFKDVPGLSMRYTGKSVFADQRPRKGSGVYKSLNEYLKEYDLGRVKAGFNSQTIHSKSLWENYVKTGRAEGFYNEPGVVHAIMKQQGGMIPKAQRGMSFAAMNQARKDEIDQLYAQADEEAKNKFNEYNATMESAYPPQVAPIKIQDKRKTLATSGQPIRPTKDLVGGTYDPSWLNEVMLAAKADNLSKEDMWNLAAMDFQETKWGKLAPFPGQVIGDFGAVDASDNFVQAYRQKMDLAKKKGVTDPATMLQFYNGMGKVFPDTEEGYHGFKMKKIYGVPVPKEGLDLSKNPLYGKQIIDIRDNVLKKNPDMVKFIDSVYNAPPNKHAGVILRREEHPEVTYWNEVRDKEDAITEKYFGSHDNYMDWVQSMEPNMPVFTDPNIGGAFQQGGVVKDNMGYWNPNNRGKVVEIDSNNITMRGVNQPLLGVSNTGDSKMMFPGRDYKFKGSKVREYPMAQGGIEEQNTDSIKEKLIDPKILFKDSSYSDSNLIRKPNIIGAKPASTVSDKELEEYNKDLEVVKKLEEQEYVSPNITQNFIREANSYTENLERGFEDYTNKSPEDVKLLQEHLLEKGYNIGSTKVDGIYGKNTNRAYMSMLEDENLENAAISKYYNKWSSSTSKSVKEIQKKLVEKGFLADKNEHGRSNIDGKFGHRTKKALQEYNTSKASEDTTGTVFNNIPQTIDESRCAAGMCNVLEMNDVETEALGIKHQDAWNIHESMVSANNSSSVYNIYDDARFKNVNENTSAEELKNITEKVKKDKKLNASDFKKGDIVGLYWSGSPHHKETLKSKTHNTHTGFVSDVVNGVPIITHIVNGKVVNQPYNELETTWITRPNQDMAINTTYEQHIDQEVYDNTEPAYELVTNLENKFERDLTPREIVTVAKVMKRAQYNSQHIPEILGSKVDRNWLNAAVFGITGVETAGGINAPRSREDLEWWRDQGHKYKNTKEKDISYGTGKIKFSGLDAFSKTYFDVNSPKDLADDNKSVDLITYNLVKNYETFLNYSHQYPELGLTEKDIQNMAILSHNQGKNRLLRTGRNQKNKLTYKEELAALRDLYQGVIADVGSTNYKHIPLGKNLYKALLATGFEKPAEKYISKVNRYMTEVYGYSDPRSGSSTIAKKATGGWLDKY